MATTNMLQWNPTGTGQESDSTYASDSQRTGGATSPSIFQAPLANKLFFQCTTFLTALFTAFANKGFTTSDASLGALTAQCANFLTTADIRAALQNVAYAPTLTFNCAAYNGFEVTLTGNLSFTLATPSIGQQLTLVFTQDGVGGRTVSWPSNIVGFGTVDTAINATSVQQFELMNDNIFHPVGPMTVS